MKDKRFSTADVGELPGRYVSVYLAAKGMFETRKEDVCGSDPRRFLVGKRTDMRDDYIGISLDRF